MADKKIFDEEILGDEQLENVVGGDMVETFNDGNELYIRGLLGLYDSVNPDKIEEYLRKIGYSGYKIFEPYNLRDDALHNIYTDKSGNKITRETFWANFDADNGTSIIK